MTGIECYIAATGIFAGGVVALGAILGAAAWGIFEIEGGSKRGWFGLVLISGLFGWFIVYVIDDIARQLCG